MTRIQYIKTFTSWRKLKKFLKKENKCKISKEALYLEDSRIRQHNSDMLEYKYFEVMHDAYLATHY